MQTRVGSIFLAIFLSVFVGHFLHRSVTAEPATHRVVIHEVAWAGSSHSASDEWIELYNTTTETISLDNWQLLSGDGTPAMILIRKSGREVKVEVHF